MKMHLLRLKNYFFILILGLAVAGCNNDEESATNDLIGTWTVSSSDLAITVNGQPIVTFFVDALGLTVAEAQEYANLFEDSFSEGFTGTVEFKSNNTYSTNFDGTIETGTWSINSAGDALTLDAGTADETVLDINSLTSNSLVVQFSETDSDDLDGDTIDDTMLISITLTFSK